MNIDLKSLEHLEMLEFGAELALHGPLEVPSCLRPLLLHEKLSGFIASEDLLHFMIDVRRLQSHLNRLLYI